MRIGIDLQVLPRSASEITGVSNYAYLLAKYLLKLDIEHQFVLFVKNRSDLTSELESLGGKLVSLPSQGLAFVLPHVKYARIMEEAGLDLLHGPAFSTPLFYRGKTVITVHDLAIYKHPEWFPGGQWFSTKVLVPRSLKAAEKIITISVSTKKDIMELFGVGPASTRSLVGRGGDKKISVIPLGVEKDFFQELGDRSQNPVTNSPASTRSPRFAGEAGLGESGQLQTPNSYILSLSSEF